MKFEILKGGDKFNRPRFWWIFRNGCIERIAFQIGYRQYQVLTDKGVEIRSTRLKQKLREIASELKEEKLMEIKKLQMQKDFLESRLRRLTNV